MQDEITNRFTAFERSTKQSPDFPFNLNDLCNFQYSFDVLKKAIEYLSKQQREQSVLLVDIIDSMKIQRPVVTEVSPDIPSTKHNFDEYEP